MSDQGIKSRPTYAPISRDATGAKHLLVLDTTQPPVDAFAAGTALEDFPERWSVEAHSKAIPSPHADDLLHGFRSTSHLLIALRHRLAQEHMGFRLYAIGTESFLWDVARAAAEAGMGRDEYRLLAAGSAARRVYCVHCRTMNEQVTTNLVTCSACGANLFVRDHFSRFHNAYMGVQIDAEVPGETLPIEELYP